MQDWPNFSGILFDSSFSLTNDPGETLVLKDASGTVVDQVTYDPSVGASGDGTTLNRSGSSFVAAVATPGAVNTSSTPPSGGGSGGEHSVAPSVTSTKRLWNTQNQKFLPRLFCRALFLRECLLR